MGVLSVYEPKEVLTFFEEICSIPHGSGNVDQISDYLVQFAKDRGLKVRQDEKKNVIIWKDGTPGYEDSKAVILQGHMDMVAVKEASCPKNLETDGLDLEVIDEDLISAKGTSLGGDDGIAVAYALALLDSKTIPHPPLEVVITTDEEIGMFGAAAIDVSDLKGRYFINCDSEDEGVFTVSCAGGLSAICHIPYETEVKSGNTLHITLTGFKGGHSGVEINTGRLNSNLAVGRLLYALKKYDIQLVEISGGEKDNAISKISELTILVAENQLRQVKAALKDTLDIIKEEYATVDGGIKMHLSEGMQKEADTFTKASTDKIIALLMNFPNGIQRMNPDMKDMVQTSLNIGIIKMENQEIILNSALRSSSETEKQHLLDRVISFVELLGGSVDVSGDYPGWKYRPDSHLRNTMVAAYREQYNAEPVVEGIHAGLECGIFASKLDNLDCISFGPQMHDIHTTSEILSISSTKRTWNLLKNTLERLK